MCALSLWQGDWVEDARTGRGIAKHYDGHIEIGRYENGTRVGEVCAFALQPHEIDQSPCGAVEETD